MLHQSIEITRCVIITLPVAFLAFAGLDLLLRIVSEFNRPVAAPSDESLTQQAIENDALPRLEPVVTTSPETQTEKAVEFESMSELEPTCYEQPATSPEQSSPAPKQQPAIETPLSQLKRYKLHGHDVVPISQLPITIPSTIKRYKLRGMAVVRVCDIA